MLRLFQIGLNQRTLINCQIRLSSSLSDDAPPKKIIRQFEGKNFTKERRQRSAPRTKKIEEMLEHNHLQSGMTTEQKAEINLAFNPETGEVGGQKGLEPTRYGDWEKNGRISDF